VTDIKTDVKGMKGEIVEIKGEMGEIKGEIVVIDFVGKSKNFEEETTVMAAQISRNTDRIEKLDLSEFGFVTVA
jgi:hypothetical protein